MQLTLRQVIRYINYQKSLALSRLTKQKWAGGNKWRAMEYYTNRGGLENAKSIFQEEGKEDLVEEMGCVIFLKFFTCKGILNFHAIFLLKISITLKLPFMIQSQHLYGT